MISMTLQLLQKTNRGKHRTHKTLIRFAAMLFAISMLTAVGASAITEEAHRENLAAVEALRDVKKSWAKADISRAVEFGLMTNTGSPAYFEPEKTLTRAEFVRILYSLCDYCGRDLSVDGSIRFRDVGESKWFYPYVEWAALTGLTSGISQDRFAPNLPVTREQLAVFLYRFFTEYCGVGTDSWGTHQFADVKTIHAWARDAVEHVAGAGLFSGKPGNVFDPLGNVTRAEAASILCRMYDFYVSRAECVARNPITQVWSDEFDGDEIDFTKWSYYGSPPPFGAETRREFQLHYRVLSHPSEYPGEYAKLLRSRANHIYLNGKGQLVIKVDYLDNSYMEPTSPDYYTSGACLGLQTADFEQPYGYYECRAIVGNAGGVNSAIWMIAGQNEGRYSTDSMEMDLMESVFSRAVRSCTVSATNHWQWAYHGQYGAHPSAGEKFFNKAGEVQHSGEYLPIDFFDGQYHTFSLLWTKEELIYFYDGIEFFRTDCREQVAITDRNGNLVPSYGVGPCRNPAHFILSCHFMAPEALAYGYSKDYKDLYPSYFTVDYVRVYQLDKYLEEFSESCD